MAEITLDGVKYTTIDDKTAMASISKGKGTFTILKKVKIDGKEYTVTKVGNIYGSWPDTILVSIPDSVTSIGNMSWCSNITIPDSVTSIGDMSYCSNITIPDSVTSIGELYKCSNITIPDSVTSIGELLYECSNITIPESITALKRIRCCTLTIPASVSTINEISGENGILMLSIKRATPPNLAKSVNLAKDDLLVVPEGAAEAYKKHPMWGKFKNISEDPSLNEEAAPASKGSANAGSNKEIAELKKEIAELRKDIANLLKAHKDLKEDFEELKKKD